MKVVTTLITLVSQIVQQKKSFMCFNVIMLIWLFIILD
jgi:hypothetical protein